MSTGNFVISSRGRELAAHLVDNPHFAGLVLDNLKKIAGVRTDTELAELLDVANSSISSWRKRGTVPYREVVMFCVTNEIPLEMALFGEQGETLAEVQAIYYAKPGADLVMVPRYKVEISAGHGAENSREEVLDYMAFRRVWLRDYLGIGPGSAAIVFARGDSMEPAIHDGDPVIIDTDHKRADDGVYVLRIGDHVMLKRLQNRMDGTWLVKSDNPVYETITLSDKKLGDLEIIGRARYTYAGRRL